VDNNKSSILLWFRQDLRLRDNAALAAALNKGYSVFPVFIHDEKGQGNWAPGGASRVWLHATLRDLNDTLQTHGLRLILRKGDWRKILMELLEETGACGVYWNRCYEPSTIRRDSDLKSDLKKAGYEVKSFCSSLLFEPQEVANKQGKPFQVYTPFWKTVSRKPVQDPVEVDLRKLRLPERYPATGKWEDLGLLPGKLDWGEKIMKHWEVGEDAALRRLRHFISRAVEEYGKDRDFPAIEGTSRLSPYLHWGSIGPRQIWKEIHDEDLQDTSGGQIYLKELVWREFAYHVLFHFPKTPEHPLRSDFDDFPWEENEEIFAKWCCGQTGYPIVDAGMRQLWEEGWMHNRVRMVVASLLVKHLLHSWRRGALWFWDTLVDADLASNTLGWQWSGGCGADAAPYFRIFNPIIQGKKFDTDGAYVRKYVPELAKLPDAVLHCPWEADVSVLEEAGVVLGENYPKPIIEHSEGRDRALKALEQNKKSG